MNAQLSRLRSLVLKDLDPAYFNMDMQQVEVWLRELPLIEAHIFEVLQEEVFGNSDNGLVERHLKQLQHDCVFLLNTLYKYDRLPATVQVLYVLTEACLHRCLSHIEERYGGCFMLKKDSEFSQPAEDTRIRIALSVGGLAYFFKLLYKVGALDPVPVNRMIVAISKNFITPGVENRCLSSSSLMTKYKQVVQTTAKSVRALLVKMLKQLDKEFTLM